MDKLRKQTEPLGLTYRPGLCCHDSRGLRANIKPRLIRVEIFSAYARLKTKPSPPGYYWHVIAGDDYTKHSHIANGWHANLDGAKQGVAASIRRYAETLLAAVPTTPGDMTE